MMAGQLIQRGERTWLVRVYTGRDANGKRRYVGKTIHGTKKDAQRFLRKRLTEIDVGEFVEPSRRTVAEYLREWLETSAKARVRERTLENYASHVERYFLPAFGGKRLDQLRRGGIQRVYNAMTERGLAPRTVRYAHSTLRSALQDAVKYQLLARNPADDVDLPKKRRSERTVLTVEQVGAFLQASEGSRWHTLWMLLVTTGLRPGEALGLKWADFEGNRLRVQRVLVRPRGGGWHVDEPKTDRSRRSVTLPETLCKVLRQHRKHQAQERLKAGPAYEDNDFMFAAKLGQPLDFRLLARRYFKPLLVEADLPAIRPYDLRHSHATLLLKAGEHVKIVSERLGHASIVMTMDVYSHMLPDMQQSSAEKVEGMLFGHEASAAS